MDIETIVKNDCIEFLRLYKNCQTNREWKERLDFLISEVEKNDPIILAHYSCLGDIANEAVEYLSKEADKSAGTLSKLIIRQML